MTPLTAVVAGLPAGAAVTICLDAVHYLNIEVVSLLRGRNR
jgi:hypothetical protein